MGSSELYCYLDNGNTAILVRACFAHTYPYFFADPGSAFLHAPALLTRPLYAPLSRTFFTRARSTLTTARAGLSIK
jgi:hypothetical protein